MCPVCFVNYVPGLDPLTTHGLRRGLYSFAAPRLDFFGDMWRKGPGGQQIPPCSLRSRVGMTRVGVGCWDGDSEPQGLKPAY
jgi:hypothetical protein